MLQNMPRKRASTAAPTQGMPLLRRVRALRVSKPQAAVALLHSLPRVRALLSPRVLLLLLLLLTWELLFLLPLKLL